MSIEAIKGSFGGPREKMRQAETSAARGNKPAAMNTHPGKVAETGNIKTDDKVNISSEASEKEPAGKANPVADAMRGYNNQVKSADKSESGKESSQGKENTMEKSGKNGSKKMGSKEIFRDDDKYISDYESAKKIKLNKVDKQHLKGFIPKYTEKSRFNKFADEYLDSQNKKSKEMV